MNPTLSWERVGDTFYRVLEGYNLEWTLNLHEYNIRASPAGGLVAAWARTDVIRQGSGSTKPQIQIYSGSGRGLLTIPWDGGAIVDAGFTTDENFVVVAKSGHIRTYYDLAGNFMLVKVENPIKAQFNSKTVVELPTQFAIVDDKVRFIDKPEFEHWVVLNNSQANKNDTTILVYGEKVSKLDFDGVNQIHDQAAQRIVPCVDGSLLAVTTDHETKVWRSDFSEHIATFKFTSVPTWIGSDGLLETNHTGDELEAIVHDLSGNEASLFFDPDTIFHSEIDGARIFTTEAHNLLFKVPGFVVDIFKLGSNAQSSVLLNCIDQLEQSSPRANENLSLIKDLPSAIRDCYTAATFEFDVRLQKKLLKAAHFGKCAVELYDSSGYLEALDIIRVANTLRGSDIALFCSVQQLRQLGPRGIVSMLQKRKQWETALGLAKLFRLPVETVPISWACAYIQESSEDDKTLQETLDSRLLKFSDLSYVDIGRKAFDEGRLQLALTLVSREPNARKRVELLMDMNEHASALDQSVKSGHIDLIYYVLLVLHKKLSLPQFYRSFSDNEIAVRCYQRLLETGDKSELHSFNYQMDRKEEDLKLQLAENFAKPEPKLITSLQNSTKGYTAKALGDYAKLLEVQQQLSHDLESDFSGLTVTETLVKLLRGGQTQRAQKIKSSFGVSDQQFYWLRIQVFADRRDWDGLWQFAQSKSPIGYLPFYEVCKNAGNNDAASEYVELCSTDLEDKVQKYLEIGHREQALEAAKNDEALLVRISGQ